MQAVYLLTFSVACALGCSSASHYELVRDGNEVCSDFAHLNSEAIEFTLLYYVHKALHGFYLKEGVRQIRFDSNTSDWYARCWPDYGDFRCTLLLGHMMFIGYYEPMRGRPLPLHNAKPEANVAHLMVHLNVRYQKFQTLKITGIQPFTFTQFEGYAPQNPYLKALKDNLLPGFHEALNSIDCNIA